MKKKIGRILYAAGPGDILGTYSRWKRGRHDPNGLAVAYSRQFYDLCQEHDMQGYAISTCHKGGSVTEGRFRIEQRPIPFQNRGGILYHVGQFWHGLRLVAAAIRFRSQAAVIGGYDHWFVLMVLPLLGIRVIPVLHCTLYPKYNTERNCKGSILLRFLNAPFFRRAVLAIMSASDDIDQQVVELTKGRNPAIVSFMPTYNESDFADNSSCQNARSPFRILFAGRIEHNKGVFDLLEVAKQLRERSEEDILFDICGDGSELSSLELATRQVGIQDTFQCHGHCRQPQMRELLDQAHVVIVPTRTEFVEGFNQVVVEAILAGRPVITSAVCPALAYVREAAVEVAPNDVSAYADAIVKLRHDRGLYNAKRCACLSLQPQFYDESRGWKAALEHIITALAEKKNPSPFHGWAVVNKN